jgi:phosphatidylglycerophosphatase A
VTTAPHKAETRLARVFRDFRYLAWVFAGLIFAFLLAPATGILRPMMHIDKVLHLTGFYLLVLFFGLGYGFEKRVLFFICGIGWALLTEGLQGLLPWRDFSVTDLVFDALGCSLVLVSSRRVGERIVDIIAKFFYIGHVPIGPGTLAALVFLIFFYLSPFESPSLPFALPALFAVGAFSAGFVARREGEDPRTVVIDEVFGALVAVAFLPKNIVLYAAAFVLFRVLDITKPFPIGLTEKIRGGLGIMIDDLVAGLFTNVVIRVIWILLGPR